MEELRDLVYVLGCFALLDYVPRDKAPVLLAVYQCVTSIGDAFDKLCSCHVQLDSIVANSNFQIAQAAVAVWWTLSSKEDDLGRAARLMDKAVSGMVQEDEETGEPYHAFKITVATPSSAPVLLAARVTDDLGDRKPPDTVYNAPVTQPRTGDCKRRKSKSYHAERFDFGRLNFSIQTGKQTE